jgi:hypothetical protein
MLSHRRRTVFLIAAVGVVITGTILSIERRSDRPDTAAIVDCVRGSGYATSTWHDSDLPPGASPNGLLAGLDVQEGPNASDVIQATNHAGSVIARISRPEHGDVRIHYLTTPTSHARTLLVRCLA